MRISELKDANENKEYPKTQVHDRYGIGGGSISGLEHYADRILPLVPGLRHVRK
jgi:hypothetical protein